MAKPPLSVIIPVYNEAGAIESVVREVTDVLATHTELDLIVVDDGSDDDTSGVLDRLKAEFPMLRHIRHPKRSGKSAALRTGFLVAKGPWAATMDGDGQDDPKDVLAMTRHVDLTKVERIGLVAGNRKTRTDGDSRRLASRFANGLRKTLLNDDCPDTACGLKLVSRDLFLAFPFFDALHRYMPAFTRHFGFDYVNAPVNNRPREAGQSKYTNVGRAAAGFFDLMGVMWLMRRTHSPAPHFLLTDKLAATASDSDN